MAPADPRSNISTLCPEVLGAAKTLCRTLKLRGPGSEVEDRHTAVQREVSREGQGQLCPPFYQYLSISVDLSSTPAALAT